MPGAQPRGLMLAWSVAAVMLAAPAAVMATELTCVGVTESPELCRALQATSKRDRLQALRRLRIVGEAAAIPYLLAETDEPDVRLRSEVVAALGASIERAELLEGERAVEGLQDAVRELIEALRDDPQAEVRREAADGLGRVLQPRLLEPTPAARRIFAALFGPTDAMLREANAALMAALNDGDDGVRASAAATLGRSRFVDAVPALCERLRRDPSARVRASVAAVLWSPEAVEPLVAAIHDPDRRVREMAVDALTKLRSREAVEPLIVLLGHPDPDVRGRAAGLLGAIGDPRAVEPLIAAAQDRAVVVPAGDGAVDVQWSERVCELAIGALAEIVEPRTTAVLMSLVGDADAQVRVRAVRALGRRRGDQVVEPLLIALRDPIFEVRLAAAKSLGAIGDPRAVEPLIAALQDEEPRVRKKAAKALGRIRDARAIAPLLTALEDSDPRVRKRAVASLWQMHDARALEPLAQRLGDRDVEVRSMAASALGELGDPRACGALMASLDDVESDVRAMTARALGRLSDPCALEPLVIALQDADSVTRAEAAVALGRLSDPRAIEPLEAAMTKDSAAHVRNAAADSLRQLIEGRGHSPAHQLPHDVSIHQI